jgi:cytochrome c-type biogenesis protein CcmH
MSLRLSIILISLLIVFSSSLSAIEPKAFETAEQEARYQLLITELRCPKCQNQNLKDSDALIAQDLKDLIHEQILAGKTNEQIIEFLKLRYGNFISYKPPVNKATFILWFGPILLLMIGLIFIIRFKVNQNRLKPALDSKQEQQLKQLLKDAKND